VVVMSGPDKVVGMVSGVVVVGMTSVIAVVSLVEDMSESVFKEAGDSVIVGSGGAGVVSVTPAVVVTLGGDT